MEVYFIKQRKTLCLQPDLLKSVIYAYKVSDQGSKMLYDVLDDPTIEIPSIDSKNKEIPRMKGLKGSVVSDNKLLGH